MEKNEDWIIGWISGDEIVGKWNAKTILRKAWIRYDKEILFAGT